MDKQTTTLGQRRKIGELLSQVAPLTPHDIEEILQDQATTHRRFGEIALSWGLVQPEHVWTAWSQQLTGNLNGVDLDQIGVDAQAAAALPPEAARRLRAVPVRVTPDEVVVAIGEPPDERAACELRTLLPKKLKYVVALPGQIDRALDAYYPTDLPVAG